MKLADYLEKKELTQLEFATTVGVTQARIAQLVDGGTPSVKLAQRIAAATGGKVGLSDWADEKKAA
jgi:transcriptional regulator with XRE-family HTH domain